MEKRVLKKERGWGVLFALLCLPLFLSACREKEQQEPEEEGTAFVTLEPVEEEALLAEGVVTFGGLVLTVPEETEAEKVTLEDGSSAVVLRSRDEGFLLPSEVYLRHFQAEWQQYSFNSVIRSIMEVMGVEEVHCCNQNLFLEELGLLLSKDYKDYYVLVRGKDIYVAEEWKTVRDSSFRHLLYQDAVTWADTGSPVEMYGNANTYYVKGEQPDGKAFFLVSEQKKLTVYQDGRFSEPVQIFIGENSASIVSFSEDMNFDGYPDLDWWGAAEGSCLLYDPQRKQFVQAQTAEDGYMSSYSFAEERTLWTYDYDIENEMPYDFTMEQESLWQWEENALVLKRECRLEYGQEEVHLWAQDTETGILFDLTMNRAEYEQNPAALQPRYEQFYQGYVPREAYYLKHEGEDGNQYIPEGLLSEISRAMQEETELETLQALVNDREVTEEELADYALANPQIRAELESIDTIGQYAFLVADVDNDGIDDILSEEYFGGTGGFTEFLCFKGQEDGSFVRTSRYNHIREEFAVISYEGKNYLCRTTYDYGKKMYDGFDLFCYENGARVEEVRLRVIPEEYSFTFQYMDDTCKEWVAEYFSLERCREIYEDVDQYRPVMGNAETETEEGFWADLNNDGEQECYDKYIWTASNMWTQDGLSFTCEALPAAERAVYGQEDEYGAAMMLWVEEYNGNNLMQVLYRTGLYDFTIVGYLLEEDTCRQLYAIEAEAEYGVSKERITLFPVSNEDAYFGL